ncbi:hypothetical protein CH251_01405 [Rhodococcus sp. 06-462-5]|uniref:hypothetical protein n=1 Tax=unclassified Rhodococcus (in: high G+C Gram-positive bacteria) TaxID=192944 RepID=UPI000B9C58BF|nr:MULTISPECIES: hypothetical protein [unclassified Rhodococcus (in: high G+C Gram-positive bacteria)]OZC79563.1 hypothetical protein CH251_01405 [Rhodococcus sp. 06-462-5]OZE60120.1 hypothetical protein CH270_23345 [Rhodococcus sp. 02-925g]
MLNRLIDRLIEAANAPRQAAKPPGPILLAFTTIAVFALVCMSMNRWPSPRGDFAWLDPLLVGAVAVVVLLTVGLLWAIRVLHVVGQDRRWSWWILPAPIVVGLGALLIVVLPDQATTDSWLDFAVDWRD